MASKKTNKNLTPPKSKVTEAEAQTAKNDTPKRGAGRPFDTGRLPTPDDISMIKNYSKIRLSLHEIAHLLGFSKDTLIRWMKKYPEISATIQKARSESKAHAVNNAYLRAFPLPEQVYDENGKPLYDENGKPVKRAPKGDSVLAIFLLKTMFGFKEPDKSIRISGKKGDTEIVFNLAGARLNSEEIAENISKHYDDK